MKLNIHVYQLVQLCDEENEKKEFVVQLVQHSRRTAIPSVINYGKLRKRSTNTRKYMKLVHRGYFTTVFQVLGTYPNLGEDDNLCASPWNPKILVA
jgi:hypothetical protein